MISCFSQMLLLIKSSYWWDQLMRMKNPSRTSYVQFKYVSKVTSRSTQSKRTWSVASDPRVTWSHGQCRSNSRTTHSLPWTESA
jgi:hypothetical protein